MTFEKGNIPWNKGLSKETDLRMERLAQSMRETFSHITVVPWHKGKTAKDYPQLRHTEKWKEQESKRKMGKGNPMFGKYHTKEEGRRRSERMKGNDHALGKRNFNWKGGVSFEPYPPEFNEILKRKIRERDNYTCQKCGGQGKVVHHIDFIKENCDPSNLCTLCRRCHNKITANRIILNLSNWKRNVALPEAISIM